MYFVHSYRANVTEDNKDWVLATSDYGGEFVAAVNKGEVFGTQFHPEKSGEAGLDILGSFLANGSVQFNARPPSTSANGEALLCNVVSQPNRTFPSCGLSGLAPCRLVIVV